MVEKVVEYCVNDVLLTQATFKARKQDFVARQVLADLSGLSVNDTTQKHTARIIFGNDRNPQASFVYTDLAEQFPGYTFDPTRKTEGKPASDYMGEDPSEGGYVFSKPGMYKNVAVYDVAPQDEPRLDEWESADTGLYRRTKVRVNTMTGDVVAWTYVLDAYEGGLPSAHLLGTIANAAEAADAPEDYVGELRRRPCRSSGL